MFIPSLTGWEYITGLLRNKKIGSKKVKTISFIPKNSAGKCLPAEFVNVALIDDIFLL